MSSFHLLRFLILFLVLLHLKSYSIAKPVALNLPHTSRFTCPTVFRASGSLDPCSRDTETTECPARRISEDDKDYRENLRKFGGDVDYFQPLNPDVPAGTPLNAYQATGVTFCYTYNALSSSELEGQFAYKSIGPPGWDEIPHEKRSRAHLWFKDFGGSAYYLNFVTMWSTAKRNGNEVFE